jgi:single-strand DNA-binding protein
LNRVELTGRLTKEPDIRYSQGENQLCIASWTLAVDRKFKREGQPTADFIRCQAFGKTGEFVKKYFHKGMKMDVGGRIQTSTYTDKNGNTVYATDVVCDDVEFGESKSASQHQEVPKEKAEDDFMTVDDSDIDSLPFS